MTTAFITHRDCWRHDMGAHHPECPERLGAIQDRLIAAGLDLYLSFHDAPLAEMEQLLRVHPRKYIEMLQTSSPRARHLPPRSGYRHEPGHLAGGVARGRRRRAGDRHRHAQGATSEDERDKMGRLECQWQRTQLPSEIYELVLDDQRLRNKRCWSLFECWLGRTPRFAWQGLNRAPCYDVSCLVDAELRGVSSRAVWLGPPSTSITVGRFGR